MITEHWDIEALEILEEYNGLQNVVIGIQWVQWFISDSANSINRGWSRLVLPVDATEFIPYQSLTPEILLNWVQEAHPESHLTLWRSDSIRQIANISGYASEVVDLLPWEE
jgi:hypothetical protein